MGSRPVFPFERNRYYSGKMLTSADFAAEQQYINDKKNFMNHFMFGSGVVSGCNVCGIDDTTLLVESGLAIDMLGRTVVIDASVVKKVSAISGFEETDSALVTLCLRYKEEYSQQVYAVSRVDAESKYEYNRIREGYELFLKDSSKMETSKSNREKFLISKTAFQDENYCMSLVMPSVVCKKKKFRIQLVVKKLSSSAVPFSIEGSIQMPSFITEDGSHETYIKISESIPEKEEVILHQFWAEVPEGGATEGNIIWKPQKEENEDSVSPSETTIKLQVSDLSPEKVINYEIGKRNLEQTPLEKETGIPLAEITLLRKDGSCFIKKIDEIDIKKYIETPATSPERNQYLHFFQETEKNKVFFKYNKGENITVKYPEKEEKIPMATGVIEIPIGGKAKPGEVFFSGEVMHGLGPGTVYVEIGQEIMEEDEVEGAGTKSTIYGNSKLFSQAGDMLQKTEKAVKVLNDKGSFIAAVSFVEETECLMLSYRWVAMKISDGEKTEIEENAEVQWIEAQTPTVVLGTRENHYFGVKFHEMDQCSITYQVTEEDGGKITPDGVYTAPNKEGVFEIMISCVERPYICTYAYAIVKKK